MSENAKVLKKKSPASEPPNKAFLISALLVVILMALAFIPAAAHSSVVSEALTGKDNSLIWDSLKYEKSIHILAMLLVGFGFLMVFVRKHGFGSVTATFLVVSLSLPMYMLIKSFGGEGFSMPVASIDSLIFAEFAAASLLIAIGAPLGRLKLDQYLLMTALFIPAYILNEWLILESGYFPGFVDTGGSVVIHAFGAYFGLGVVSNTLSKFKDLPGSESDSVSNQFCLIGSMVLWIFWPSFTSALVSLGEVVITVVNTIFALSGATLATYVFSRILRGKVEIEDIANAALAGGVAIGSTCNLASPGYAMLIGVAAGALSTVGYVLIAPKVEKLIKGTDTCGVHNLHGMPGILGGVTGAFVAGNFGIQLLGIVVTVVIGFGLGKFSGIVLNLLGQKKAPYSDEDEFVVIH